MLIDKKKDPYIRVFKLTTSEEIIAKVVNETDTEYAVEKPLQLSMGERGLQFAPISIMLDFEKTMMIKKSSIVFQGPATDKMENGYESTTTGIVLPPKGSIITA
jgi:hypothetical protein